jgi:hypothetical protein
MDYAAPENKKRESGSLFDGWLIAGLFFVGEIFFVALDYLAATVEAVRGNVMATMHLTGVAVLGQGRLAQRIVGTTHAALGTGFAILLNCHCSAPV